MLDVPAGLVENGFERISCIPSIGVACRLLDAIRPELAVAGCEFFTGQMTQWRANNSRVLPRVQNLSAG